MSRMLREIQDYNSPPRPMSEDESVSDTKTPSWAEAETDGPTKTPLGPFYVDKATQTAPDETNKALTTFGSRGLSLDVAQWMAHPREDPGNEGPPCTALVEDVPMTQSLPCSRRSTPRIARTTEKLGEESEPDILLRAPYFRSLTESAESVSVTDNPNQHHESAQSSSKQSKRQHRTRRLQRTTPNSSNEKMKLNDSADSVSVTDISDHVESVRSSPEKTITDHVKRCTRHGNKRCQTRSLLNELSDSASSTNASDGHGRRVRSSPEEIIFDRSKRRTRHGKKRCQTRKLLNDSSDSASSTSSSDGHGQSVRSSSELCIADRVKLRVRNGRRHRQIRRVYRPANTTTRTAGFRSEREEIVHHPNQRKQRLESGSPAISSPPILSPEDRPHAICRRSACLQESSDSSNGEDVIPAEGP